MRKLSSFIIFAICFLCGAYVNATPAKDLPVSILWKFDSGVEGQSATVSLPEYFSTDYVSIGSNLKYAGRKSITDGGMTYTQTAFQPMQQDASANESNAVCFTFKLKTGMHFTPTKVSCRMYRHGTDGGKVDIVWKDGDVSTTLATALTPMRNNTTESGDYTTATNYWEYAFQSPSDVMGEGSLVLYLYSLGNSKQVSYGDIKIEGVLNGEPEDIPSYTLTTKVSPDGSGEVRNQPMGQVFDENTLITLSQSRNFGFRFVNWTSDGVVLSTDESYTFNIVKDITIVANYEEIPTYSLTVNTTNGAKDYMVSCSPEAEMKDGKMIYEGNTMVTLTAANNPIMTFSNWDNGETLAATQVTMDTDKTITAEYNACDYIVGWDFWRAGNNGRPADFFTDGNDATTLVLRNVAGATQGWLDKSQIAAGGYEGKPAAVNWKNLSDHYYYQTKINASNYTDIHVQAEMLYNYNAYSVQKIEYSLDNENWTEVARCTLEVAKSWTPITAILPPQCDNQESLFIRFIPDYNSVVVGTETSNDGTAITNIFITGNSKPVDDGKAPVLLSSLPEEGTASAGIAGKIVLNFSKKVTIADDACASLGNKSLSVAAVGKTVTCVYKGLEYGINYTFALPANVVSDMFGRKYDKAVVINFSTKTRPAVTKGTFDVEVRNAEELINALSVGASAGSGRRYRIFLHNGTYDLGKKCLTSVGNNISLIGESRDGTIIVNDPEQEGISITATLHPTGKDIYMQDLSLQCGYDYATNPTRGRLVALQDDGQKTIYKNVALLSNQDTYYSHASGLRSYFETCLITGTVDFLCGGGDVFFENCTLNVNARNTGNVIAAPSTSADTRWGYVFNNCIVDGDKGQNGVFSLGRPWQGSPAATYLSTTFLIQPQAAGWTVMGENLKVRFHEFGSVTRMGTPLDLSARSIAALKPAEGSDECVIDGQKAAQYTLDNVLGGNDDWNPASFTEQAPLPANVKLTGSTLSWDANDYVLCWAVCKNGQVVAFTIEPSYMTDDVNAQWTVRAANEMGGLGEEVGLATSVKEIQSTVSNQRSTTTYNLRGEKVSFTPRKNKHQVIITDGRKFLQ